MERDEVRYVEPAAERIADALESIAASLGRLAAIETDRMLREVAALPTPAVEGRTAFELSMGGVAKGGE